jgi:hypothetical protein
MMQNWVMMEDFLLVVQCYGEWLKLQQMVQWALQDKLELVC